jgi:hypothetical protein
MSIPDLLSQIDAEIERLQKARTLVANLGSTDGHTSKKRRKRRRLSTEARAKIAAAQRKRWAAHKRAAK